MNLSSKISFIARLILLAIPVWTLPLSSITKSATIFSSNFESGFTEWKKEYCCSYSVQTISSPVRAGKRAIKLTLKKDDPYVENSKRSELRLGGVPANSEQWYGYSMFLPSDYKQDPSYEIITQWHELPDMDLGETWRTPPLSVLTQNGNFKLHRRWDSKQVTKNNTPEDKETVDLGPYRTGVWTDFVFHIKWSHKSDGLLEVWQDGKLVVRKTGPNTYNDKKGPYFKLGVYKPDWRYNPKKSTTTQRDIYFDEVKISDASSNYKDVAPGSSMPPDSTPVASLPKVSQPATQPATPANQQAVFENFSTSASNFTVAAGGAWSVSDGKYILSTNNSKVTAPNGNVSVHQTPLANNFVLTADAVATTTSNNWDDFSLIFNYQDSNNYYYASFNEQDDNKTHGLFKVEDGARTQLANFDTPIQAGTSYKIKIEKTADTIKVYQDGNLQATVKDSTFSGGKSGFGSYNSPASFDNFKIE